MLDSLGTGNRTTILAVILTLALAAVVIIVEMRRHGTGTEDDRRYWVLPVVVGLSIGIGALLVQRLLTIVPA